MHAQQSRPKRARPTVRPESLNRSAGVGLGPLFEGIVEGLHWSFGGATFDPALDGERLGAQLLRVRDLMADGLWRTLGEISAELGAPQASVSARLRDLRKPRFGGFRVQRRRVGEGLFAYRVTPAEEQP